jgi:hypothetical protein
VRKNESIGFSSVVRRGLFASGRRRRADSPQEALSDKAELKKSHRGAAAASVGRISWRRARSATPGNSRACGCDKGSYDVEAIARDRGRALPAFHQRGKDGRAGSIAQERRNLDRICCNRTIPS